MLVQSIRHNCISSNAGGNVGNLVTAAEQEQKFLKSTARYVLSLCGTVLVAGEIDKLLLEKAPGCPRQRQVQPAPKWTHHYTAEPISDAGGISVMKYLRKGKEDCSGAVKEWSEENMKHSR